MIVIHHKYLKDNLLATSSRADRIIQSCFLSKNSRSICSLRDGTDATKSGVRMEKTDTIINHFINFVIILLHEFYSVICQSLCLIRVCIKSGITKVTAHDCIVKQNLCAVSTCNFGKHVSPSIELYLKKIYERRAFSSIILRFKINNYNYKH